MRATSTKIEDAGSPQLGSFSSILSHRRWVTSWVGKAIHDTNIAAKLLIYKQEIPGAERYDIVQMFSPQDIRDALVLAREWTDRWFAYNPEARERAILRRAEAPGLAHVQSMRA